MTFRFVLGGLLALAPVAYAQSFSTAPIPDPAMGMPAAFTATIPAGWRFQGTVLPGGSCNSLPHLTYRAYSTDGLSEIRMEPRFDWLFLGGSSVRTPQNGCIQLDRQINAEAFVRYYANMINAQVLGSMPITQSVRQRGVAQAAGLNQNKILAGFSADSDTAAMRVAYANGTFVIEERIEARVDCKHTPISGAMMNQCSAFVDVLRAPKGRLDLLARAVDGNALLLNPQGSQLWAQKEMEIMRQQAAAGNARLHAMQEAANRMLKQQADEFRESMNRRHEQFMAEMQASTNRSLARTAAAAAARDQSTSDWVDFALDRQTVTGAGGTVHISSAYSHTWSNGDGQWYQTNNANVNPNGSLPGNWTEDTKVHGNGTPY